MKKLYYIEQVVFLRDMLEALCKQNAEYECYTTDEGRNSLYFFQDMKPDMIFVDWATIASYEKELFEELSQVAEIAITISCDSEDDVPSEWKQRASKVLTKPLEAKSLLKNIFS